VPPIPPADQEKINQAIDAGVAYLKRSQTLVGMWGNGKGQGEGANAQGHAVAYTAFPGLTLLRCGVPPNDPVIQKAADLVRQAAPGLENTYELALSVLFLDQLGDPKDKKLIQQLAVRLIAGQTATGGWTYTCPMLNGYDQQLTLNALLQLNPSGAGDQTAMMSTTSKPGESLYPGAGSSEPGRTANGTPGKTEGSNIAPAGYESSSSASRASLRSPFSKRWAWCIKMGEELPAEPARPSSPDLEPPAPVKAKAGKPLNAVVVNLPENLRRLAVFRPPDALMVRNADGKAEAGGDNSNTQFAILALWTARRHGVPMDRSLALILKRFQTSQNQDGSWGYTYSYAGGVPEGAAMTCVGLLGLAIGHGFAVEAEGKDAGAKKPGAEGARDWRLLNGFVALSRHIGQPTGKMAGLPMQNLYFLWSVERVGVLYNLSTIADKDWYRWGAEILVANQQAQGHWQGGSYHGNSPTLDTCLALLFLKRANLVADLTSRLPFDPNDITREVNRKLPTGAPPTAAAPPPADKQVAEATRPAVTLPKGADVPPPTANTSPSPSDSNAKPVRSPTNSPPSEGRLASPPATESGGPGMGALIVLVLAGGGGLLLLVGGVLVLVFCLASNKQAVKASGKQGKTRRTAGKERRSTAAAGAKRKAPRNDED
jgi:hypothetical protein